MTSLFIAAFIMGAFGSMHCIGMCGPLALSLPVVSKDHTSRFISTLLYNAGRIITYSLLGAVVGVIGMSLALFGFEKWLSIILGLLIILFILIPRQNIAFKNNFYILRLFEKIRSYLGRLFIRKNYSSVFFIGLLNGLLPCGLVFIAVTGAISTASILKSSLFMAFFGLGTLPVMWSIAFFGSFINMNFRRYIKALYPYIMFLMAILLIVRGMGIQVPYMNHQINHKHDTMKNVIECIP